MVRELSQGQLQNCYELSCLVISKTKILVCIHLMTKFLNCFSLIICPASLEMLPENETRLHVYHLNLSSIFCILVLFEYKELEYIANTFK